MERLTNKKEADAQRSAYKKRLEQGYPRNIPEERFLRLAAYEDTGLESEQVKALGAKMKQIYSGTAEDIIFDFKLLADHMECEKYRALGTVEELTRGAALVKAQEEGLLVALPCKVGDNAYFVLPDANEYLGYFISEPHEITEAGVRGFWTSAMPNEEPDAMSDFTPWSDFGKTVFLTRQEAEAVLGGVARVDKKILDVTCGSRTIWFNKNHPAALYCDKRRVSYKGYWKSGNGKSERDCTVDPDVACDFTELPFPDSSFPLIVFDPPHLTGAKDTAWLVKKYGRLDDTWPQMIHDGFRECMRVLKPDGVLVFKWSEYDIPAQKVWDAIGQRPLFGHRSGKQSRTFWGCFMKLDGAQREEDS